ncbi:MAG: hypothetical protein Q9218_006915 [Villophora microphyllina]
MLSTLARSCFVAAVFACSAIADAIAFGNPAFAGITFGSPFVIDLFGGDGTAVTIRLLTGNPAALTEVATLAAGAPADQVFTWTPAATDSIRPGQLYSLSVEQSGLTNYSPMFGISTPTAASGLFRVQYGAPLPVGTGHYYAIRNVAAPANANVYNSEFRLANTGFVLPRSIAVNTGTGTSAPRAYATGNAGISGSISGSGAALRGAGTTGSPIAAINHGGSRLALGAMMALVSASCVLLLLWT